MFAKEEPTRHSMGKTVGRYADVLGSVVVGRLNQQRKVKSPVEEPRRNSNVRTAGTSRQWGRLVKPSPSVVAWKEWFQERELQAIKVTKTWCMGKVKRSNGCLKVVRQWWV